MKKSKFSRRALLVALASVSGWLLLTPRRPQSQGNASGSGQGPAQTPTHAAKPGSGRGPGGSTANTVMLTNSNVFNPQVTWVNGRAKITNAAKPNIPAGNRIGFLFDGGPQMYLDQLPDISFPPYTQINIYTVISPNPVNRSVTYTDKADCIITLGAGPV